MSLDPTAIARIKELQRPGRPDVLRRILQQFAENTPRQCAELSAAFSCSDFSKATLISHTMKSSAATVGALELAASLRGLELLGHTGQAPTGNDELERMRAQADQAVADAVEILRSPS